MASDLAADLRFQAQACADLGSPFYADLLRRAATDFDRGGPVASVLTGYEDAPRQRLTGLRLLGAVHRLVLAGQAPQLAPYYPSVGGQADARVAWPALLAVLDAHGDAVRDGLTRAPQTNEVGRAAPLLGGLLHVAKETGHPVRLYEIGASAGLNLLADRYRVDTEDGRAWGPPDSPVYLGRAWQGSVRPLDARLRVAERRGCDLAPVDPRTEDGRLTLMSYVWPDDTARMYRLRGALEVARQVEATVEHVGAGDFLAGLHTRAGTVLVVWHSVMWQYLDEEERARVDHEIGRLGADAAPDAPFAHLRFEPRQAGEADWRFLVMLRSWPGGVERVLGEAPPHGVPVTWW